MPLTSAGLVGHGHLLEHEGDLGSPSGGRPPVSVPWADRPAWLQASGRTPGRTPGPTAGWV